MLQAQLIKMTWYLIHFMIGINYMPYDTFYIQNRLKSNFCYILDREMLFSHCEMRSRSWQIIDTAAVTSSRDVLFGAQSISNIRILSFHQSSTLKFLKYFWTLFSSKFWATPWSNNFSSTNRRKGCEGGGKSIFHNIFLFVLKACVLQTHAFKTCLRAPDQSQATALYKHVNILLLLACPSQNQ